MSVTNVKDVELRLDQIRGKLDDPKRAHLLEDVLYISTLRAIADGYARDPAALARATLKAADIDFIREYQ